MCDILLSFCTILQELFNNDAKRMTVPVIKSFCLRRHLDSNKKFSVIDSEALMTADNSGMGLNLDKAGHLNICGFGVL